MFCRIVEGVFPLAPRLPRRIIRYWLLGEEADNALIDHFKQAVNQVSSAILFRRVQQISKLHPPRQSIQLPCVYIQPDNDKLIDPQCICLFQSLCADFELVNVPGPHFLLQAKPEHVAAVLWRVIENKISHSSHG